MRTTKRSGYFFIAVLLLFRLCPVAAQPIEQSSAESQTIRLTPERHKKLNNPLTGWAIYGNAFAKPDYWQQFDSLAVAYGGKDISDFANVLYMRVAWSDMEPEERVYGWKTNPVIKMLISGALERKMRIAFRIVIDSRDKPKNFTPDFVKQAGAKGFTSGWKGVWTPYVDDPVFRKKYEQFMKAFGAAFNKPGIVDFIDAYGFGKWGESHSVNYLDNSNRAEVFEWVNDLYARCFTKVPLVINYHRLIGRPKEWGTPDSASRSLLESAFAKGFGLRHDAFGMTDYYKEWEKQLAADWFPHRPVICEGGWLHNGNGYLKDPRGYKNWGEAWQGEYDDAIEAHANMMDLRDMKEAASWFEEAMPLVHQFNAIGGYRFYPDEIKLPRSIIADDPVVITHRWNNLGIGVCPVNVPQWNQKYKVAFALIDKDAKQVKQIWIDNNTNLSTWLKGKSVKYDFSVNAANVPSGNYHWAVAIVDTTHNNKAGIILAVEENVTPEGWLLLSDVTVK